MPANKSKINITKTASTGVFVKVCKYCLPTMGILMLIPFSVFLITLLLAAFKSIAAAEFVAYYIAFPLTLLTPLFCSVKVIFALKGAFPRNTNDSHGVILSTLFCSCICTLVLILLFNLSLEIYSAFPLSFLGAAYMRDMYASSHGAMFIFYLTVFIFYTFVSLMIVTSYFIGDGSKKRFRFTLSCITFLITYVIFLILLIFCYFISTFLDITALENIQIVDSVFNSSVLCIFVTFDVLAIICAPALYFVNYKVLKKRSITK